MKTFHNSILITMEKKKSIFFSLTFLLFLFIVFPDVGYGAAAPKKLIVFGDSYADTGNTPNYTECWKEPYGTTFPGQPSGRFSDGRVLTDFIANYMGIRSPVPYKWWKLGSDSHKNGLNFAYGGTGVFNTLMGGPNMTIQINIFQQLIEQRVFTKHDLSSSVAHVSAAGNDYSSLGEQDLEVFTKSVINQLVLNLRQIYDLGVPRITVVAAPPFGCITAAAGSNNICDDYGNFVAIVHNELLKKAIEKLNNETGGSTTFVILDLYTAFMSALNVQNNRPGKSSFENQLEGCCKGTRNGSNCGDIDENGRKEYVVCDNPNLSFFWDSLHPTQQGWLSVFDTLAPSLHNLLLPHSTTSSAAI